MKIIIDIAPGCNPVTALTMVEQVVLKGQISEARIGSELVFHYCWATVYENGFAVVTRRKKTAKSPDSFIVEKVSK